MPDNMIALFVAPADRAKLLAILPESLRQYAQPAESLHLTLRYWEGGTPENLRLMISGMTTPERIYLPMTGKVQGWGVFEQEDKRVVYASFDHALLPGLRQEVMQQFSTPSVDSSEHGFVPHITLAYLPKDIHHFDLAFEPFDLTFDRLYLASDEMVVSNGPVVGVQELDTPLETHFELAKSVTELPNGDLEIIGKGVPFKGPAYLNGKDLTQEYFDKSTDIGPLPVALSYFHHGKDPFFGKSLVGTAERLYMDPEEGWFYKIIVDKAAKYKKAIKALAEQGWLGLSSTPFQRTAEKSADGHWNTWHVVEVCLTYSPAHPEADVKSVIEKSIGDMMPENINNTPAPGENDAPAVETPVTNGQQAAAPVDVVAEVQKALNEGENQTPTIESILEKALADFGTRIEAIVEAKLKAQLDPMEKSIRDINVALPLLAKKVAAGVKTDLQGELQKSAPERAAESAVRNAATSVRRPTVDPSLPPDAPGNY